MKNLITSFVLLVTSAAALDTTKYASAATVAVTNSSFTNVTCPLAKAHIIQVYIKPSSTAQAFTVRLVDTTTIEVPSGGYFTLRIVDQLDLAQVVFAVQTSTGAANLQVVAFRESK